MRPLSPRQRQVLALAARGLTTPQIADELGLSVSTVKVHLGHARLRLRAANTTHAVALAVAKERG